MAGFPDPSKVEVVHLSATVIGALQVDATINVTYTNDIEVTEHPVEKGAAIVDHFRVKPQIVTIEGIVTETRLPRADRRVSINGFDGKGQSQVTEAPSGSSVNRQEALKILEALRDSEELTTISTPIKDFKNMKMTSLSIPRDAKTGEAMHFTATFREIRIVSLLKSEFRLALPTKAVKAADKGSKSTNPTPDPWVLKSGIDVVQSGGGVGGGVSQMAQNAAHLWGLR